MKVRWKKHARSDLRSIRSYIAENNPKNATEFVQRIVEAAANLNLFPEAGSPLEEFPDLDFREIYVGEYRVIFRVHRYVSITRIFRGGRLLTRRDLDVT